MTDGTRTMERRRADGRTAGDAGDEIVRLRRELAEYQRAFDSARLVVGHEFTRPLTAASGYLDLLEERLGDALGETERGYIAKMRDAFARLDELVESFVQMLRVEHAEGGFAALELVDVRLLLDRIRERYAGEGARIETRAPAGLPALPLRRRCLEVALENLVSNALKHGGAEAPVILSAELVYGRRDGARNDRLVLAVEDRGAGIPQDKIEEIFSPFVRLDTGTHREGLGLGLALVKSVVAIMRGEISVRSAPGEGTVVTVVVPVGGDDEAPPDAIG